MTNESEATHLAGISLKKFLRRRWWLAGLLNVVGIGTGHVYSGKPARGLTAFLLYFLVSIAMVFWFSLSFSLTVLLIRAFIDVGLMILITVDAIRCARAAGSAYEQSATTAGTSTPP